MSVPKHTECKDSEVHWLGKVPSHWKLRKLKYIAGIVGGGTPSRENLSYWNGDIPWVSPKDMKSETIVDAEERITELGLENSSTSYQPAGRLLMVIRSGILQHTLPVAINDVPVAINQDMKAFSFKEGQCCPRFFMRWVQGLNDVLLLAWANEGATVESINLTLLQDTLVPLPDLDEQKAISSFLDVETSKIDGLVSEQRRLIELLKEKRQAVISHAVTKGLNPNAPMKPSGIQWLGDVPEHWRVKPLKYLATFRSGGTPSKTVPAYWHGDVPWASSKDLKTETLADTIDHITQHALDTDAAALVPAGSVLVVVRGMILLHTFPVVQTLVPMAINQDLKSLTPAECIHASYLPCLLRGSTDATFGRIDEAAHGTKVLRMEAWTSIKLPVPPIEEQLEIVEAVEKQLATLSQLQAEAERAIELLQERRTALISAAVTGKIDVRGFAPKENVA